MNQITTNRSDAENLRRSTREPRIRQQVIAANVAWKATNTISYMGVPLLKVAARENTPVVESKVPLRNRRSNPPKKALPVVKASE